MLGSVMQNAGGTEYNFIISHIFFSLAYFLYQSKACRCKFPDSIKSLDGQLLVKSMMITTINCDIKKMHYMNC